MTGKRGVSNEERATAWPEVRQAAQVPDRVQAAGAPAGTPATDGQRGTRPRSWSRIVLRRVLDVAVGLALIVSIPLAFIAWRGDHFLLRPRFVDNKLAGLERYRVLRGPIDASMSPQQAGAAMHALTVDKDHPTFPTMAARGAVERPWETRELAADLFANSRSPWIKGPSEQVAVTLAAAGFTAREMEYLRAVAESPVWRDVDALGRAARVDVIGGRFVLPFREDAWALDMPMTKLGSLHTLAKAGVQRAAYYVATGRRDLAERSLRNVVSLGFALIDNGTSPIDAVVGRLVVEKGRDGLHQLYVVTGDTRLAELAAPIGKSTATAAQRGERFASPHEARARMVADARNAQLPRTERFENLSRLAFESCSSVRGVFLGPSPDVLAAFDDAKRTLARFPSEQAYLDLLLQQVDRAPADFPYVGNGFLALIDGPGAVASIVLHNPRIATCTRIVIGMSL